MKKFLLLLISIISFTILFNNNNASAGFLDETYGKNMTYVNQPMNTLFTPLSGYYTIDFDFFTLYVFEFVPIETSLEELIRTWSFISEHFIELYDINTEEEYLYQPNENVYPSNGRIGWSDDDGLILLIVADIVFEGSDINTVINTIYENTYVGVWIFSEGGGYDDGYNDGYDAGYEAGRNDGYNEGRDVGYNEGYDVGYNTGRNDGYNSGYNNGYINGEQAGYARGLDDGFDNGYNYGYDEGYELGYDAGLEVSYDYGYNNGYQDGFNDGFNEPFISNIHIWLVPAIIIVFVIGIFVTYRRGRE